MKQLGIRWPKAEKAWGGRRRGAGRPRKDGRVSKHKVVQRVARPLLASRFPVLVTWRMREHVWSLRSQRGWKVVASALWDGARRDGFRVVHFAIMGNHIHMLVEAESRARLSRGLQGLGCSIARRLNRMMRCRGPVMGDRYHARILKTPTEVRNARAYLLRNAFKHYRHVGPDRPFTSEWPLVPPQTWLMRLVC